MRVRIISFALIACTLLPQLTTEATAQSAFAPAATLIVPGNVLGPLRLGMTPDEVHRVLGQPSEVNNSSPIVWNAGWQAYRLWAVFRGRYPGGSVVRITTQSSRFATKHGIRVGSSISDVLRKLGRPLDRIERGNEGQLTYTGLTLAYKNRRVYTVAVDEP